MREAKLGGVILWVYLTAKGTLALDGSVGARLHPVQFKLGLTKDQNGVSLTNTLEKRESGKFMEAPYFEGEASLDERLGPSVDVDFFAFGVHIANVATDVVADLNFGLTTQSPISYGTENLGEPWHWSGRACLTPWFGAGVITSADVHLGYELEFKNQILKKAEGSFTYTGQWPSEEEIRVPGWHNNVFGWPWWYTLKTDQILCFGPDAGGNADTDGDGMPDAWEIKYGLNPGNPADAELDADGDGISNLLEYQNGTDPTQQAQGLPAAVAVNPQTGSWTSSPQFIDLSAAGAQRIYCTLRSTVDGSEPAEPPEPTEESHDPCTPADDYIAGNSGQFQLFAAAGQTKKLKARFRGWNATGYGPASASFAYTLDLSGGGGGGGSSRLNDTGITLCGDAYGNNDLDCHGVDPQGDPIPPGQDALYGRDAQAAAGTLVKVGGGHAGFDFTKIDGNGNELPASATDWSCVRDNVTGLMWEVKTDDGGLHDWDWTYSWYEPDGTRNGGFAGYQNGGGCGGTSECDTHAYVQAVNAEGWCGHGDWRLPTVTELQGIASLDRWAPPIDPDYFPRTQSWWYWSSSPVANGGDGVWYVSFYHGIDGWFSTNYDGGVRLVRGGQ